MSTRTNWRDCKEWRRYGLPFSSTSNESCKLYDAALSQFAGFYNEPSLGGLVPTLTEMLNADPTNVMGHVIALGLDLFAGGKCPRQDEEFRGKLAVVTSLTKDGQAASDWERRHVRAIRAFADGYLTSACNIWEDILVDYPLDFLAARFAFTAYIFLGFGPERRDSSARIIPLWKPDMPHYGYVLGMHAFGLVETNVNRQAETLARQALDINPRDIFANHSLVHVLDYDCRYDDGLSHMAKTVDNWSICQGFACHTYWHWALFHIEKGDHKAALDIYDAEVGRLTLKSHDQFNMTDSASLLFRLEMEGMNVGDRWSELYEVSSPMMDGEQFSFADPHITMCSLGSRHRKEAEQFAKILEDYSRNGGNTDGHVIKREVGADLCRSLVAYYDGNFNAAVELLHPLRYKLYTVGGSNAQRDVFNQFLIHCAMKSSDSHHNKLARSLLLERKQRFEVDSPLTERLLSKLVIEDH